MKYSLHRGTQILFITFAILCSSQYASAATQVCVDLKSNLGSGSRGNSVYALQGFLYKKGYLRVSPNGVYGPQTSAAVKKYQKALGYAQSGNTLSMTRAALWRETCPVTANTPTNKTPVSDTSNQPVFCSMEAMRCPDGSYVGRSGPKCEFVCPKVVPVATTTDTGSVSTYIPAPTITAINRKLFFENGTTSEGLIITGQNFNPSNNDIYAVNQNDATKYYLGKYPSSGASTTITLSQSIAATPYSCGSDCKHILTVGSYNLYVYSSDTPSNPAYFSVNGFTAQMTSGTENNAIWGSSTAARLGTFTLYGGIGFVIEGVTVNLRLDDPLALFDTKYINNFYLKDELTGERIAGVGGNTLSLTGTSSQMAQFQTKIIGVYADVHSPVSGLVRESVSVAVHDVLLNYKSVITSPEVLVTFNKF